MVLLTHTGCWHCQWSSKQSQMERRTGFFQLLAGKFRVSGAELRNCSHPGFRRESGLQSLSQLIALGWS